LKAWITKVPCFFLGECAHIKQMCAIEIVLKDVLQRVIFKMNA